MAISRNKAVFGGLTAVLLAAGLPALAQQQSPESILPPGFGDPAPAPAPTPAPSQRPTPQPTGDGTTPGAADPGAASVLPLPDGTTPDDAGTVPALDAAQIAKYDMPDFARRSLLVTGIIGPKQGGLRPNAFGRTRGRFIEQLMGRMNAPIASRWLSIELRRMLASQLNTPAGLNGADFAAERAWLLVRMGEPIVGRAVVQSVDVGNFTPKLYEAALQAALASADPAALCPIASDARGVSHEPGWTLASAFCTGLSGNPEDAGHQLEAARRSGVAAGIDLLLAQKVLGTGARGQQAVTIEWDKVDRLTAWRYGLATATGVAIPAPLIGTANPRVRLWQALAPTLDVQARVPMAEMAAAQGVLSNAALVDLFGDVEAAEDQSTAEVAVARDLRTAYVDADPAQRLTTMKQLWDEPQAPGGRYARLILTARAAARLPVENGNADADSIVASMLSAGLVAPALRWRDAVARGGDGWAMLTVAEPVDTTVSAGDIGGYQQRASASGDRRAQALFAALAGLGRVAPSDLNGLAKSLNVDITLDNAWTRAIDRAAAARQPATVLLLAGIGMQTTDWHGVSAAALYRIVAAMRSVGLEAEARMIAVEALTRL